MRTRSRCTIFSISVCMFPAWAKRAALFCILAFFFVGRAHAQTPNITGLNPSRGGVGQFLYLYGSNFGSSQGTSTVTFNGTAATVSAWTSTQLSLTVPSGATTGNVVVTVGGVASNGATFTVITTPFINSMAPYSGGVGQTVNIYGSNYGASQGTSTVTFNGTAATVGAWTNTQLSLTVPSGATTGNLIVTVGGVASNAVTFIVVVLPTISASVSPAPNSSGWINLNATVTFTCTAGTLAITGCPSPQTVSTDGLGQIVSGTVSDTTGNQATASVTINLDKTIPSLSVTSPADGTSFTTSTATVSGTLSDALSGASGVTCDGVTATLSGGAFSCNISLTVGVNLVVVRGTDMAGNVAGYNFHVTLTGSLPAATSLQVTPTGVNMVVGGTQQFTVVDDQGRPRSEATWSVDNTSIATIDTNSSPTLAAVATGTATLTATVGSVTAQTQVNVLSGTSLPDGTILWSAPSISGYTNDGFFQTQPLDDSGPDVIVMQTGPSGQTSTSAFTNDGRQMWQTWTNDSQGRTVPSQDGGQIAEFHNTTSGYYLAKIDGTTGNQVWQYPLATTTCCITQWAVGADGMLYALEPQLDTASNFIYYTNLMGLDGATGTPRLRIPLPTSSSQLTHVGCSDNQAEYNLSGPTDLFGPPEIAEDGGLRIEFTVESILFTLSNVSAPYGVCDQLSVQYSSQLQLWTVQSDGTYTSSVVTTLSGTVDCLGTTDDFYCPYHHASPGEVIPDGLGGSLVSWKDQNNSPPGYSTYTPTVFHVSDVASNGGTSDFTLPSLQPDYYASTAYLPMVLGENNAAFVSAGKNVVAFNVTSGQTLWTYSDSQGIPSLVVSAAGGGLTAKTTGGADTVLRFDPSGTLTTDSWSGPNLDYYIGNLWFGSSSSGSGSPLIAYSAAPVNLSSSAWFALDQHGSNRSRPTITVSGFSQTGPNQTAVTGMVQVIITNLQNTSFTGSTSCMNWVQSTSTPVSTLQTLLDGAPADGIAPAWGHGVLYADGLVAYSIGAVTPAPPGPAQGVATVVNDVSGFFSATPNGQAMPWGIRLYPGNSTRARAAILLHEIGHLLALPDKNGTPFQSDNGDPAAGKHNDQTVDANCRQFIEAL